MQLISSQPSSQTILAWPYLGLLQVVLINSILFVILILLPLPAQAIFQDDDARKQINVLTKSLADLNKNITIITERSLYTDKEIFAKMLYDQGKMSDVEHQIYLTLFDEFASEFEVNKVVYIRTDPTKCHERIHLRAREGEELIPLAYLEECHEYHEAFLDQDRGLFKEQLVLDGNQDIYQNPTLATNWMQQIDGFIFSNRT